MVPCLPSESWSTAITRELVRVDRVAGTGRGDVGAGDQRRGHLGPEAELRAVLGGGQRAVADLQHVRVVPVPGPGVGGQAHVAVEDRQHAGVAGVDVAGGAPAVADAGPPGPHAVLAPVAQAVQDRPAGRGQGVAHGGVAGLGGRPRSCCSCRTSGSPRPRTRTTARRWSRAPGCRDTRRRSPCPRPRRCPASGRASARSRRCP